MKNILLILLTILFLNPYSADAKSTKLGQRENENIARNKDSYRGGGSIFTRDTDGPTITCNSNSDCPTTPFVQRCLQHYCKSVCLNETALEALNGDPAPHCPDYPETPKCYEVASSRISYCACEDGSCSPGSECKFVNDRKKCVYCTKKTSGDSSTNSEVNKCGCLSGYPNGTGQCVTCPNDYYCGANERCYSPGTVASKCVPLKCETGSIVDHNCQDCDVDKCIKCSQDTSICEACKDGYHLTNSNTCIQCAADQYWSKEDKECKHIEGCLEANQDDNDGTCLKCDYTCDGNDCKNSTLYSSFRNYRGPGPGKGFGYGLLVYPNDDRSAKKQKEAGACVICTEKLNEEFDSNYYLTNAGRCELCNNGDIENKCKSCGYSTETSLFICSSCSTKETTAVAFNDDQTKCKVLGCTGDSTYAQNVYYETALGAYQDLGVPGTKTADQVKTAMCVPTCSSLAEDPKVQESPDCSSFNNSGNYFYGVRQTNPIFKRENNHYQDMTCYRCEPVSIPNCIAATQDETGEVCTACAPGYAVYSVGGKTKCGNVCTFTTCSVGFTKSAPLRTNVVNDTCACNQ